MEMYDRMINPPKSLAPGRRITNMHFSKSNELFKESWTPLKTPRLSSSTRSCMIWVIVRSTTHKPESIESYILLMIVIENLE